MRKRMDAIAVFIITMLIVAGIAMALSAFIRFAPDYDLMRLTDGWTLTCEGQIYEAVGEEDIERILEQTRVRHGDCITLERVLLLYHRTLPAPTLLLDLRHCAAEVLIDGNVIERIEMDKLNTNGYIGSDRHYVSLPQPYDGKKLTIRYYFAENNVTPVIREVWFGEFGDLHRRFLSENWYPLCCGVFLCMFGIFFLLFSTIFSRLLPELQGQMVSSLITLDLGVYILTHFRLSGVFMRSDTVTTAEYFSFFLVMPLCWVLLMQIRQMRHERLYRFFTGVVCVTMGAGVLLHLTDLYHVQLYVIPYYVSGTVFVGILMYCFIQDLRAGKNGIVDRLQMTGIIAFCLCTFFSMLWYLLVDNGRSSFFILTTGAMFFAVSRFMIYLVLMMEAEPRRLEFTSLNRLAYLDTLTGLYNRMYVNEQALQLNAGDADFCIISMDLNGLKKVNDIFGHAEGDRFLQSFSHNLRESFREEPCIIARIGGDEFLVIIEKTDESKIRLHLNALRKGFALLDRAESVIRHSVSTGYAFRHEVENGDVHSVYMLADERMYRKKRALKRAVRTAGTEV